MTATVSAAVALADLAALEPLVRAHIDYERAAVVLPDDWAARTATLVAAGKLVVFAARSGGEQVGYASVTTDVATWTGQAFAHLDCLFVAREYRGGGVGRLLVDAVAHYARGRGHGELQWQTPGWNADAVRFYERLGATHRPKERFALVL